MTVQRKIVVGLFALFFAFALSGCASSPNAQSGKTNGTKHGTGSGSKGQHVSILAGANWQVADFKFTDENGKPFGLSDLKGKVWLTDMIFTHCTSICPLTTAHMSRLQSKLKKQGLKIPIVSFSVDPKRDKPSVMKAYGKKFGADFSTWHFLTGYSPAKIKQFVRTSFKSPISHIANTDQFTHSSSFFLINQSGKVMARYDGLEPPYQTIIKDVKALKKSNGKKIASQSHAVKTNVSVAKALSVKVILTGLTDSTHVQAGKPMTIEAFVTQGKQKVNNAENTFFKVWKKGESPPRKIMAKNVGNGLYSINKTFQQPGTYFVMPMIHANGQSAMVTKKIVVKK